MEVFHPPLCAVLIRGPGGYISWDFAVMWDERKFGSFHHGDIGEGTQYEVVLSIPLPEYRQENIDVEN